MHDYDVYVIGYKQILYIYMDVKYRKYLYKDYIYINNLYTIIKLLLKIIRKIFIIQNKLQFLLTNIVNTKYLNIIYNSYIYKQGDKSNR